jgi:hypothetical protein
MHITLAEDQFAVLGCIFVSNIIVMCKFGYLFSKIGLAFVLLSILVMVVGWFLLNIKVCVVSVILMCLAAFSFIVCMACNGIFKGENKTIS